MRISADCIDEEQDNRVEEELSEDFSQMALKDNKMSDTLAAEEIHVIYKVNYSSTSSTVSLSVVPVTGLDHYRNGYKSNWFEVKQQVLDLNFKDRSKVPKNLAFIGRIESAGYELPLINEDEYFTALKVAELCGQPLDIMIKNSVEEEVKDKNSSSPLVPKALTENKKIIETKQFSSDSENDSTEEGNGFVVLESTKTNCCDKQRTDSSTQLSSDTNLVVMSKTQIEDIKKEITIDVTKRLISKLNECLTELTNESTVSSPIVVEPSKVDTRAESMTNSGDNDLNNANSPVVHIGIICDNCDHQIRGVRYKCINCLDFDLCEKCKEMPLNHEKSHTFNKIERYIRGIPKQTTSPQNFDFLKPFLTGATIDPKTREIYLSLDVDLTNGKISTTTTSPSNPVPSTSEQTKKQNSDKTPDQTNGSDGTGSLTGTQSCAEEEVNASVGPQLPQRRYVSEKKANKIAKKLEKLKLKSQLYNNLLTTNDERPGVYGSDRSKPSTVGLHNQSQPLNSNKTLYLSGLLIGDETIPEGTRMPPGTRFRKTWKVRNTGTKVWTGRTTLRFVWGHSELEPFGKVTEVQAPTLRPGEEGKVTIRFTSPNPSNITRYQSHWRLHHRGQPFGQRLVCKVIVDPSVTIISPAPNGMLAPILAKAPVVHKSSTALPLGSRPPPKSPYLGINATNPSFNAIAQIHQSILESQRSISETLRVMTATNPPALLTNPNPSALKQNKEKTQKTSVKKLTEALSAVKEIRFNLDDNESIPMKPNVKSHTATPANTPFDVSPPKSPEPSAVSNSFTQIESTEKNGTNDSKEKISNILEDEKANESDNESLDVLSLSSGESLDEFVLVPLPSCFDLNVPFFGVDNKGFEDTKDENNEDKSPNPNNCFELIDENMAKNDETLGSDENTASEHITALSAQNTNDETNNEIALDLTKDKHREEQLPTEVGTTTPDSTPSESEPQVRPKIYNISTNPFRNNSNDTENVIHVLPESIVTGALSAAAHVYNNVKTTFFSNRNEGTNFAWVTSPPPAALPLPEMYWENRRPDRFMTAPQEYATPIAQTNSVPIDPLVNASAAEPQPSQRLANALTQLFEMGFWNQKLNQELLEKNDFDVNDTIEDLLSPGKDRQRRNGPNNSTESVVVSHQPQNNRNNGFIEEFD